MNTVPCGSARLCRGRIVSRIKRYCLVVCLLVVKAVAQAAELDLDKAIEIAIPANTPIDEALLQWGMSAGVTLMKEGFSSAQRTTQGVTGRLSARQALSTLLQNSDFTYSVLGTVVVVRRIASPPEDPERRAAETDQADLNAREPASAQANRSRQRLNSIGPEQAAQLEQVLVLTGTHIHDAAPSSPTIIINRDDIDRSGSYSVADLLSRLPQNFRGGLNNGNQNTPSQSGSSTLNLRGLGSGATLILVDGHRLATSEGSGSADVNLIPLAAVERIEVMLDGSSAIYGSDAVGGVVNFVLRKDYRGSGLSGTVGATADGGGDLRRYSAISGTHWDSGNLLASLELWRQAAVDSGARSFAYSPSVEGTSLVPTSRRTSVFAALEQDFPRKIKTSLKALCTRRSNQQTENLYSQVPGLATADATDVRQYAFLADAEADLSGHWRATAAADFASDNTISHKSFTLDGTPYVLEDNAFNNSVRSLEFTADGPLAQLPPGNTKLAVGMGQRWEAFETLDQPGNPFQLAHTRSVRFAFAEILIPLLSPTDSVGDPNSLAVTLADRFESYSDFGSRASPKFGLVYRPRRDLQLRVTRGASFRAPTMLQEYGTTQAILESVPDRTATGSNAIVLQRFGGNPQLRAEQSSATTLDLGFTPSNSPGTSMQLTYYRIDDRGRIEAPTLNTGNPLSDPRTAPFITLDPTTTLLAAALAGAQFWNITGRPFDPATVAALVDNRLQNISWQRVSGFDFVSRYRQLTRAGQLNLSLNVTYLDLRERVIGVGPPLSLSGTVFFPPRVRGLAGVSWDRGEYTASVFLNYVGTSRVADSTSSPRVPSWSTVDTQISYNSGTSGPWGRIRVAVTAQNLLNRRPPPINTALTGSTGLNFDSTNTSAVGRMLLLHVSKAW